MRMDSVFNKLVKFSAACALLIPTACAEDGLVADSPKIGLSIPTDGRDYATIDVDNLIIDLGEVPLYSGTVEAVFEIENSARVAVLNISAVEVESEQGGEWMAPEFPEQIPGSAGGQMIVRYSPEQEGTQDQVVYVIRSNDRTNKEVRVTVRATGVLTGAPDIEVEYTGYRGPELDVDCDGTTCTTAPLNMGNVGLGATGSARVVIRNKAACGGSSGSATLDPCGLCGLELTTELDSATNVGGLFAIEGSASGTIPQRDLDCGNEGEARILVRFDAPITEGLHETKIILTSNDPDKPLVEIPLQAAARNAPIAIAKFAPQSAPGDSIEPLGRVYLDGSDSYDPEDPTDPTLIAQYIWEVVGYPAGANPSDFDITGQGTPDFNMFIPIAGTYRVRLIVTNTSGIQSGDTDESFVEFDAAPSSRLYVQLTWDNTTNDQDLHLVYESGGGGVCTDNDCYFSNCNPTDTNQPVWHSSSPPGEGANPTLDIDDTNGLGPETINIDDPEPGTYRIYVHNYSNHGDDATRNTIRVLMDGIPVAEFRRRMVNHDLWAVADIVWSESGGTVQPVPSDSPNTGVVGQIETMPTSECTSGGLGF